MAAANSAGSLGTSSSSSAPSPTSAPPPYELEQFQVVRELGNGMFGVVKEVKKKDSGEIFAMKVLDKQKIVERKLQTQLRREVLTQLRVRHPNVVQLHYYFEDTVRIYLLLEYADQGQLFRYLREQGKALPEARAAAFLLDTARGIEYLHGHHIAHRDVKPENVLLFGAELTAKISDLGWCVELTPEEPTRKTFCGTLDYCAPEMLQGEPHGLPVDVWALGVLLFEMLLVRAPFTGKAQKETMDNICAGKFDLAAGAVSTAAEAVLRGLLVVDAAARPTVAELLRRHSQFLQGDRRSKESSVPSPQPSKASEAASLDATRLMPRRDVKVEEQAALRAADPLSMDATTRMVRPAPAAPSAAAAAATSAGGAYASKRPGLAPTLAGGQRQMSREDTDEAPSAAAGGGAGAYNRRPHMPAPTPSFSTPKTSSRPWFACKPESQNATSENEFLSYVDDNHVSVMDLDGKLLSGRASTGVAEPFRLIKTSGDDRSWWASEFRSPPVQVSPSVSPQVSRPTGAPEAEAVLRRETRCAPRPKALSRRKN
eukprot:TRINITY_DN70060_c0_g1_i2.p1 TRINITY_DN70060_c0_g1~~TRINITY_DN70060_c0_g1_i2.p1  ORF type:complete len:542 (+),score=134.14 TRINITY_DN70060_c0_g1_i2:191-1816(+)